jgi:glycosyltransferase involved in cell wall biosynthesis
MKICFYSPGFRSVQVLDGDSRQSGGAEAQIARLAAAFSSKGNQVSLIYGNGQKQLVSKSIRGVKCIEAVPSWKRLNTLFRLWNILSELSPELIYARLPDDFLWQLGMYSKLHRSSKFMYAIAHDTHCNPWKSYDYKPWFHNPLYALGLHTADIVALQHEAQFQLVASHSRAHRVLIPNLLPYIAPQVRSFDETSIDVIWVARVRADKQLPIFLDLVEDLPNIRFSLVGGFDSSVEYLRDLLEKRLQTLKNLSYLGAQRSEEVLDLLAQSKVLVNTSSYEGFPNTMLEAWSRGVPVVSLTVDPGGIIQREQIGLVSGTVAQLRHDIVQLVRQYSLNDELGRRGLAYVRRQHSFEAVCKAFDQAVPGTQLLSRMLREDKI